jgi:hypothetical protein
MLHLSITQKYTGLIFSRPRVRAQLLSLALAEREREREREGITQKYSLKDVGDCLPRVVHLSMIQQKLLCLLAKVVHLSIEPKPH